MTDNLCSKCRGTVVMHAFCQGTCEICGQMFWSPNTPAEKICFGCIEAGMKKGKILCRSCGEEIKE